MTKIGIFFILIWLATSFFIVWYIRKIKNDLLQVFSDKPSLSKKAKEYFPEEDKENTSTPRPFCFVSRVDPKQLLAVIQQEHPQVIALVLAYLEPNKSSVVLQGLPCEVQADVIYRIANMDHVESEVCLEIERVLEKKLSRLPSEGYLAAGGIENTVEILNLVDDTSRRNIIGKIKDEDPGIAEKINLSLVALKKK